MKHNWHVIQCIHNSKQELYEMLINRKITYSIYAMDNEILDLFLRREYEG